MPDNVQLRPVVDEDRELLFRIYASTRAVEMAGVPWSKEEKERFLRMQFQAQAVHYEKYYPKTQLQIILVNGEPAGRLYVDRGEKDILIIDIAILPQYRGQGTGTLLLQGLINESEETGIPISIHVEQYNPALRLYERLGFRRIEEVGVYDLMQRPVSTKAKDV